MAIHCPHCGAENPEGVQFCNLCCASFGFENLEYTSSGRPSEGYRQRYPSSFQEGAPAPPPGEEVPPAQPVDIGEYGVRSGTPTQWGEGQAGAAGPVEIGTYGAPSGIPPSDVPGEQWLAGHPGMYGAQIPVPTRRFDWGKALWRCTLFAAAAAVASMILEMILGFMAVGSAFGGNFTLAYVWILIALLLPGCAAAFAIGYRLEEYGWAVGLITVMLWAFLFRPLYSAILNWLISDSLNIAAAFNKFILVFDIAIFIPLGLFLGWLGEKRATTGLWF